MPRHAATHAAFAWWSPLVALVLASGCDLGLDNPTIVKTSRILAVVAEPPSVLGGQPITVDAMISIPDSFERPLTIEWRACNDPQTLTRATGIGGGGASDGEPCDAIPVLLAEDDSFIISGDSTAQSVAVLQTALDAAPDSPNVLGSGLSTDLIRSIIAAIGVAMPIELRVLDASGQELVRGFKRVTLHTGADPGNTNPPAPAFEVIRAADPEGAQVFRTGRFECGTGSDPIRLVPNDEVALRPTLSGMEGREEWLETYPVFDFTGGIREVEEDAFYTWFVTAGSLSVGTTEPPNREVKWRIPTLEVLRGLPTRRHSVWLVVRDGHLGTSACRLDVEIEGLAEL